MKNFFKLFFLFLLLIANTAYADSAEQQLTTMLGKITTLQANFTQTIYDRNGTILQQTNGQMSLQRPGKFRWEIKNPNKQLLIADGKQIWFYDADLAQVTVQKQQTTAANSPAMLLSGSVADLAKNFKITKLKSAQANEQTFKLVPKNNSNLFQAVELSFNNDNLQKMRLNDSLNQATNIDFSKVRYNFNLSPESFHFSVPHGVDVVKQ